MKRVNYLDYTRKGGVVTITITDEDGSKLDTFKYNRKDKKTEQYVGETIYSKYGINLSPTITIQEAETRGFFDS